MWYNRIGATLTVAYRYLYHIIFYQRIHMETSIHLQSVCKSYREGNRLLTVLDDVNTKFCHGKFSVLLGKSGSGKSSLLNLITGVDIPDRGNIVIGDVNITKLSEHERTLYRRRNVGIVFQFFNLIPTLTVLENVTLPLDLDAKPRKKSIEKALYLLERVSLQDRAHSMPDVLSGGEQQRVAIARALVHDPHLIISDEPTGNLDQKTGQQVLQLLLEVTNDKTLIMATHNLDVVSHADFVYRITAGDVVEENE